MNLDDIYDFDALLENYINTKQQYLLYFGTSDPKTVLDLKNKLVRQAERDLYDYIDNNYQKIDLDRYTSFIDPDLIYNRDKINYLPTIKAYIRSKTIDDVLK